jgi:hypothetical protein
MAELAALIPEIAGSFRATKSTEPLFFGVDELVFHDTTKRLDAYRTQHADVAFGRYAAEIAPYRVDYRNAEDWGFATNGDTEAFFEVAPEVADDVLIEWRRDHDDRPQDLVIFHCKSEDDAVLVKLALRPERPSKPRVTL